MKYVPAMKGKMVQVRSVIGGCNMPAGLPDGAHVKLIDFRDGMFEVEFEEIIHRMEPPCIREFPSATL